MTLPAFQAGVRDERATFARRFAAELAASGTDPAVDRWIHFRAAPHGSPAPPAVDAQGVSVLVVPGIFGDCVADQSLPFGDGQVRDPPTNLSAAYGYLAEAGFTMVRAVPVHGRWSSAANAAIVADAILQEAARPEVRSILLVAYSKGVPDTLEALAALEGTGALPRQPLTLVSVAGVVMGTPIADRYDALYRSLLHDVALLHCTKSDGHELSSLAQRERARWLAQHPPPAAIRLYSVVAHTAPENVAPGLSPFYRLLARVDARNDGQVLSSDAVLPNSTLLAEADSDHWTFLLPLASHPSALVRALAAQRWYPRQDFFRALLRTALELDARTK